jgi:hypothetical protein
MSENEVLAITSEGTKGIQSVDLGVKAEEAS